MEAELALSFKIRILPARNLVEKLPVEMRFCVPDLSPLGVFVLLMLHNCSLLWWGFR